MKKLGFLIVFIIFVSVLPSKLEAKALPRPVRNTRSIHNYINSPLQMRERNERKDKFENLMLRKTNLKNIPVYIITRSKTVKRTSDPKYENLFDANGMIYVTDPKKQDDYYEKPSSSILKQVERRSYDLSKRNRRKLMAMMNKELNRQLIAKANKMRRNFEVDFNDMVA